MPATDKERASKRRALKLRLREITAGERRQMKLRRVEDQAERLARLEDQRKRRARGEETLRRLIGVAIADKLLDRYRRT